MKQARRHRLSFCGAEADIWQRRKAGESLHAPGRAFDKDHGFVQFLLSQQAGSLRVGGSAHWLSPSN